MSKFKHYTPKQVALAKWNNEQRPKYEERIKHDERKALALRKVEDMEARSEMRQAWQNGSQ